MKTKACYLLAFVLAFSFFAGEVWGQVAVLNLSLEVGNVTQQVTEPRPERSDFLSTQGADLLSSWLTDSPGSSRFKLNR